MYLKYYKKKKPPISSQLIIISIFASILNYYTYECIKTHHHINWNNLLSSLIKKWTKTLPIFPIYSGCKKKFLRGIFKIKSNFFFKKKKNFYIPPQIISSFSCVWYMSFFDDFKKKNQKVTMWCVVTYLRYEMTNQRCHKLSQIYPLLPKTCCYYYY